MIQVYDKESGTRLGEISESQLQFLIGQMEEESLDDHDYYLNGELVDEFESKGADAPLVGMLRAALGSKDGVEIRWERTG
jgi:hypothetical protein